MRYINVALRLITFLALAGFTAAEVPQLINYQGRLTDAVGGPMNGDFSIIFTIYDDPELSDPGNIKWQETHASVTVTDGLFSVLLGSLIHLDESIFSDSLRYLGIKVGEDQEISPRSRLVTTPYAFRAGTIDGSSGGTISGNVGIDVSSPSEKLDVAGQSTFRRGDGIQDKIIMGVGDPNVAFELRSGTTGGTPYIDFVNDDINDYDARIRLRGDGLLALEGNSSLNLQVDGRIRADNYQDIAADPSEDLDGIRSYYYYKGTAASPYTYQGSALRARIYFGGESSNPVGTGHGITSESVMLESGDSRNEMTPLYLGCVAHAPCRLWGVDMSVHGPVSAQADLIQGLVNFVNNYNADPIPNKGHGMVIATRPGAGGSATAEQQVSQTYPLDAGLAIVGFSGTPDEAVKTRGFQTGLQIGGAAGGWMQEPLTSILGTGIMIKEIETCGVEFRDFYNMDAPALVVNVPNVMDISESGVDRWRISQEGAGVNAALLLRDLTEVDEWWWGAMAGGDKRLSFQKDRMVVMRDGNVGIGNPAPGNILTVEQFSITDPIADAWTTYSSARWKENVKPIINALEMVRQLRGVYFDWKETKKQDIGMIAEEVGEVIPEAVEFEKNGIDAVSIDYGRLTAVLIEAVKELKSENEELKKRIERLETQ